MNERDAFLILNAVPGIGSVSIHKLIKRYGSAVNVVSLNESDLSVDPLISSKIIQNILQFPKDKFLKAESNLIDKNQAKVVTWLDDGYPKALRQIPGAPAVLYVKGDLSLDNALSMAVVGSRRASYYGISTSEKFAQRLAELGFTTVSGMARGIDTAAHRGALKAGGTTIAVLGCGLCTIYPPENGKLFEAICESGAVISEFPMQTAPLPTNFPRRNRIISGLSLGVIVVEAAARSGALITADFALEQGKEVFAIPGKIDHPSSQGVHKLIQQGAKLITSVDDVLEDIKPHIKEYLDHGNIQARNRLASIPEKRTGKLSTNEKLLFEYISDRPVHVDELTKQCGPALPVMSVLLQLELKHLVKQLPGKLFVR